jgi:hypothetical protein
LKEEIAHLRRRNAEMAAQLAASLNGTIRTFAGPSAVPR